MSELSGMSPEERRQLLAEYEALRDDIAVRAVNRDLAALSAADAQQAAHRDERLAWELLTVLRDAHREEPGNLRLVAQVDQAEAAHAVAREVAETVSRAAEQLATRALEYAQTDARRLYELGVRIRAARAAEPDIPIPPS
ncbi:hypothetical protein [Couchioplanes azureus]|uniref:hypothetical protein n=1 Tax=Couchioplanes caeruleus TaxID=56438 RepID=UPI00167147C5|nr:hypothetical protein [Couchioplanes caeruleus]GGQ60933.1 hypothetical protein GCM10010166_33260 [Couchioplanes caeruleus subsp. azureus]